MHSTSKNTHQIATAFVNARHSTKGIETYPGDVPQTLDEAYAIQDAAIKLWPHKIGGWKIGGIGAPHSDTLGATKLAGPVFENQIYSVVGSHIDMPVYAEGFAAIEPEIVVIVNSDQPADKATWTLEEAADMVERMHIGVEIASSPFPEINDMGPLVTISDFGNNNGLIIAEELENWKDAFTTERVVETIIDAESVGVTNPANPLIAFRFLLENVAARGMPLKKGMAITTGAITGVHRAFTGQSSTIHCSDVADIELALVTQKSA